MLRLLRKMIEGKVCIIIFGIAGSGKGTQSAILANKFSLCNIAPGDIIRESIRNKSMPQDSIDKMNSGALIETSVVVDLITSASGKELKKQDVNGVIFDGFPRNMEQDDVFKSKVGDGIVDLALYFKIDRKEVFNRLSNRFYCSKCNEIYNGITKQTKKEGICDVCGSYDFYSRNDDKNYDALNKRFDIFEKETIPIINRYSDADLVYSFDASKSREDLSLDVEQVVGNFLNKKLP